MKLSQIKNRLKTTRAVSTEQGDISITVNQGEQENPAVDPAASMPPELTDPSASIADQPEVTDTLAEVDSDKADVLNEAETTAEVNDLDAGIDAGEEAIETLESYRAHIHQLNKSGMPITLATIESFTIGIEHAVGRFNISAAEFGIPSTESFSCNPSASLEALDKQIVASMEGISDSISAWYNEMDSKLFELFNGVERNFKKQIERLQVLRKHGEDYKNVKLSGQKITDTKILGKIRGITSKGTGAAQVLAGLKLSNAAMVDTVTNRIPQIDKLVEALIKEAVESDKSIADLVNEFQDKAAQIVYADSTSLVMLPSGWQAIRDLFGGASKKTFAVREYNSKDVPSEVEALSPQQFNAAVDDTVAAFQKILAAHNQIVSTRKEVSNLIKSKLDAAIKGKREAAVNASNDADSISEEAAGIKLKKIRSFIRNTHQIETMLFTGARWTAPAVVDFLTKNAGVIEDAYSAPGADA